MQAHLFDTLNVPVHQMPATYYNDTLDPVLVISGPNDFRVFVFHSVAFDEVGKPRANYKQIPNVTVIEEGQIDG